MSSRLLAVGSMNVTPIFVVDSSNGEGSMEGAGRSGSGACSSCSEREEGEFVGGRGRARGTSSRSGWTSSCLSYDRRQKSVK